MEYPISQDPATQIGSSQSFFLNDSIAPHDKTHDITQEFLNQNQIINDEIMKFDQMLKTWPMFIYKVWTVLYVGYLIFMVLNFNLIAFPLMFEKEISRDMLLLAVLLVLDALFGIILYANVLLWVGLYKKDILRVERSLTILKWFAILGTIHSLVAVPFYLIENPSDLMMIFGSLSPALISLAMYFPALYVKGIFAKRQVFQRFSNYPDNTA